MPPSVLSENAPPNPGPLLLYRGVVDKPLILALRLRGKDALMGPFFGGAGSGGRLNMDPSSYAFFAFSNSSSDT